MSRYVVVPDSESGHCCFTASVLDTNNTVDSDVVVCECFRPENAERIARLLNEDLTNDKHPEEV